MPTIAADLDLGGGDPGVARADDPVDRLDARVAAARTRARRSPGRRPRRAARRRRAGRRRRATTGSTAPSGPAGRRDDDLVDAGDAGRDDGHHERRRIAARRRPGRSSRRGRSGSQRRSIAMPGAISIVVDVRPLRLGERRRRARSPGRARRGRRPESGRARRRSSRRRSTSRAVGAARRRTRGVGLDDGGVAPRSDVVEDRPRGVADRGVRDGGRGGTRRSTRRRGRRRPRPRPGRAGAARSGVGGRRRGRASRDDLLDRQDEDPGRAGRLEPRQQAPDVVGADDRVDRDHARRGRAG